MQTLALLVLAASPAAPAFQEGLPRKPIEYAVVVNPQNLTDSVALVTLKRLFKAEIQEWSNKEPVSLVLPKSDTKEKGFLLDRVFSMDELSLKKHWTALVYQGRMAEEPKPFASPALMLRVVEKTKGALALLDRADVGAAAVKILAVDGKRPGERGYAFQSAAPDKGDLDESPPQIGGTDDSGFLRESAHAPAPQDQDRTAALEKRVEELEAAQTEEADLSAAPRLVLRGFGHVQLEAEEVDSDAPAGDETSDAFALGGLDLLVTSQLSKRISFLNETVFEPTEDGEYVLDVERVVLRYHLSDQLNVHVGRFHTTLGAWNETFHHGEWLQTPVGRPRVVAFEDEDGLLPVHLVGVVLKGRRDVPGAALDWSLEAGNGRGPTPDPPQLVVDANDPKGLNLAFGVQPNSAPGLRLGGNVYVDRIPTNSDPAAGPLHGPMDELIAGVFATYETQDWELFAEYFSIDHEGAADTESDGWYLQLARRFGAWTPYGRIEGVDLDDQDTFFTSVDDVTTAALGLRWDVSAWNAIKIQVEESDVDAGPGGADETRRRIVIQTAFAF